MSSYGSVRLPSGEAEGNAFCFLMAGLFLRHPNPLSPMHAFFPPYRPFPRRFLSCLCLIAACLFFPALAGAEPEGAAPDAAPATPPA